MNRTYANYRFQSIFDCSGNAMVELAIVIPVLLLVTIVPLGYAAIINSSEILSNISHGAGNAAFRDCGTLITTPVALEDCLSTVINDYLDRADIPLSIANLNLGVSVYTLNGQSVVQQGISWGDSCLNNCNSKLDANKISANFHDIVNPGQSLIEQFGFIVVAEAFYRPRYIEIFPFIDSDKVLYEKSIY